MYSSCYSKHAVMDNYCINMNLMVRSELFKYQKKENLHIMSINLREKTKTKFVTERSSF